MTVQKPQILVVETQPAEADALVATLADAGYSARVADPGSEGLDDMEAFGVRGSDPLSQGRLEGIIGRHPSMQSLFKKVVYVAGTKATVLITGESGTGKELVAAAIHGNSKRRQGPFVRLNCASLARSVLESELFGHEKGAFTGALSRREGRFKQAHGGTLLLDEVAELPPAVQVKLLRFLQERQFERVGGNETLQVDVRVVAATNRNLETLVADGRFREDLYYRLAVVRLEMPPLRARASDIIALATHFLDETVADNELGPKTFTPAALDALLAHSWPGNVRELRNAVEQAAVLSESRQIDVADLPIRAARTPADSLRLMVPGSTLAEIERYAITKTLEAVGGSATRAAEILGISRRTIQYRIKEWGLSERAASLSRAVDVRPGSVAGLDDEPRPGASDPP